MAGKEKQLNEKAFEGQIVDITLLDRAENSFTHVTLDSYTEAGATISWISRGVQTMTLVPRTNISHISMRTSQAVPSVETKMS